MFMPVLKKDENYNIMQGLLQGETNEVKKAITQYYITGSPKSRDELAGEVLDVVQICIGILDKLEKEGLDIENATLEHLKKLVSRQIWVIDKMIKIEIL